jgi:hypothetical protein
VLHDVLSAALAEGFTPRRLIQSPLKGPAGNIEFLAWFSHGADVEAPAIDQLVADALDVSQPDSRISGESST